MEGSAGDEERKESGATLLRKLRLRHTTSTLTLLDARVPGAHQTHEQKKNTLDLIAESTERRAI